MKVSLALIGVNTVLNFMLVGPLGAAGTALATSIASYLNVLGLVVLLRRRLGTLAPENHIPSGRQVAATTTVMAAAVVAVLAIVHSLTVDPSTLLFRALETGGPLVAGVASFLIAARYFDPEIYRAVSGLRLRSKG
jgi:putative peptidoglycan lipid II flippase